MDCPLGHHLQVVQCVSRSVIISSLGVIANSITNLGGALIFTSLRGEETYRNREGAELHQTLRLILVVLLLDLDVSHLELLFLAEITKHTHIVTILAQRYNSALYF